MPAAYHFHFRRHAPPLYSVMRHLGPFTLRPHRDRFGMLVRSIISQQISTAAAKSIHQRVELLAGSAGITPQAIARLSIVKLRSAGLSPQKAMYVRDLAQKVREGCVPLTQLGRLSDPQVIRELTRVKGIGRWTAQMFLIFALGRPNVFPVDDWGIRRALRTLYGFEEMPTRRECLAIGSAWHPYATIGSWYCWRYLDQTN